jgi:hypothetical protein
MLVCPLHREVEALFMAPFRRKVAIFDVTIEDVNTRPRRISKVSLIQK